MYAGQLLEVRAQPVRRATQGSSRRDTHDPQLLRRLRQRYQGRAIDPAEVDAPQHGAAREKVQRRWVYFQRKAESSQPSILPGDRRQTDCAHLRLECGIYHQSITPEPKALSGMLASVDRHASSATRSSPCCSTLSAQMSPTLRISKSGMSCCETAGSGKKRTGRHERRRARMPSAPARARTRRARASRCAWELRGAHTFTPHRACIHTAR